MRVIFNDTEKKILKVIAMVSLIFYVFVLSICTIVYLQSQLGLEDESIGVIAMTIMAGFLNYVVGRVIFNYFNKS